MKVNNIKEQIEVFKSTIQSQSYYEHAFKWEALNNFTEHWNEEAKDIKEMYAASFYSKESGRLWGGERESPKSMMIELLEADPEFMRSTFRNLYMHQNDLILRLNRFGYHCDQVLKDKYRNTRIDKPHYHNDYKILSVYLSFKFPLEYTIYEYEAFKVCMSKLELRDIPDDYAAIRYMKLSKALFGFLLKDEDLIASLRDRLNWEGEIPMLLVHDFYETIATVTLP